MAKKRPERHLWYSQFLKLKSQYPDTVLLYRLGDFYEVFDDDAKLVASTLGVTLTRKACGSDEQGNDTYAPMAGMPYHAVDGYIGKLVGAGYRVAVAEQMSLTEANKRDTRPRSVYAQQTGEQPRSPGQALGRINEKIEHREVVRVITPGTRTDASMLQAAQNNYLAAVIAAPDKQGELRVGLAYADLTTGEFCASEFGGERALAHLDGELARLNTSELLVCEDPRLRPPGMNPAAARLQADVAPMTKHERKALLPHERVARQLEGTSDAAWLHGQITGLPAWRWEERTAQEALLRQLCARSLAGFGLADKSLATRAAGAIVQYLHETQRGAVAQISSVRSYGIGTFMFLDPQTRRNLALTEGASGTSKGSLVKVLDHTRTPMGARLLRRWLNQPLLDRQALLARQERVARFVDDGMLRAETREALRGIGDLERTVNRVVQGIAHPRDIANLRESLRALPRLVELLGALNVQPAVTAPGATLQEPQQMPSSAPDPFALEPDEDLFADELFGEPPTRKHTPTKAAPQARQPAANRAPGLVEQAPAAAPSAGLDPCAELLELLERALDDAVPALLGASDYLSADPEARRVIRQGFSPDMDKIIAMSRDAKRWLAGLEAKERERTGIRSLKVGYNKVFGYYIELPRAAAEQVPERYERRQTLVGSERYVTQEMKEVETVVTNAETRLNEMERAAFDDLCAQIAEQAGRLLAAAHTIAEDDVFCALAEAAVRGRYRRPELRGDETLQIVAGRHPIVEQSIEGDFIANDSYLDTDSDQILVITGANMVGKSTLLRQVALIVLLAQIGAFVPADQAAIGLVDRIFTRIGAQDDIATGQSTFMVEMTETAALLAQSTRRSLIILDEVGRGTSTYDGMAIAQAVVEYIHNNPRLGCRTLFATHYHELTELERTLPRVRNYHLAVVEQGEQIVFLHELRRGGADRSYGIHVAELAGIPRPVIARANELLAVLENRPADGKPAATADTPLAAEGPVHSGHGWPVQQTAGQAGQLSLFDLAPSPVVNMLKRLNVDELTPIEALTKLYELKRLASEPFE
jgi:DNA mismatch repair protein MutS